MKKTTSLLFVFALLLLVPRKGSADQPSVLTDIRYGVSPACSRVTLVFGGDIRFSTDHGKSLVRLGFSRTRLAPSPRAARLRFSEGLVQNVVVRRVQGDSLSVAVTLREHTTYRCVQPSGGNELHIDVFPREGMAVSSQAVTRTPPGDAKAPVVQSPGITRTPARGTAVPDAATRTPGQGAAASVLHPTAVTRVTAQNEAAEPEARERAIGLIDVAAIARAQIETENRPPDPRARTTQKRAAAPAEAGSPLLLIGLMTMVALTSGGFVFVIMRRTGSVPARPAPSAAVPPQVHGPARGMVSPVDEDLLQPGEQEYPADEEDGERETSLQLARSFRRGSEEITLARRLHAQPAAPLSVGKMQQMLARSTTQTQRLHAARKLGVGRGELDLALKLKTLRPATPKNEEDV